MARKIQTAYRGYRFVVLSWKQVFGTGLSKKKAHFNVTPHRCRKLLLNLKKKKKEYDELMEKLQRDVSTTDLNYNAVVSLGVPVCMHAGIPSDGEAGAGESRTAVQT